MKQPPDKIYLQWHGDGEPDDVGEISESDVTWCKDKIYTHDIEYVQAARIAALEAAIAEAKIQPCCKKCGVRDIYTRYHKSCAEDESQARICDNSPFGNNKASEPKEHLHRICRTCGFDWCDKTIEAAMKEAK